MLMLAHLNFLFLAITWTRHFFVLAEFCKANTCNFTSIHEITSVQVVNSQNNNGCVGLAYDTVANLVCNHHSRKHPQLAWFHLLIDCFIPMYAYTLRDYFHMSNFGKKNCVLVSTH